VYRWFCPHGSTRGVGAADTAVVTMQIFYSTQQLQALEVLADNAYDGEGTTEVIRPAAVLPEQAARIVLAELGLRDVRTGGHWLADPSCWRRYDRPWNGDDGGPGSSQPIGSMQVAYGTPTRYEITIFRATITRQGSSTGWTVTSLCDEAMGYGGLTLAECPRADLRPPPRPFRLR
jgi:hypothetical protein